MLQAKNSETVDIGALITPAKVEGKFIQYFRISSKPLIEEEETL